MYKQVIKWLAAQNVTVSKNWLRLRMESHPDYPSLVAVQDTLDEIGIESYACAGSKEEVRKEAKPVLAHFNVNGGDIRFFNSLSNAEKKLIDFDKHWSGHVMLMEKPENKKFGNAEHDALLKKEKRNFIFSVLAAAIVVGIAIVLPLINNSFTVLPFLITALAGIYISWLITQKEFGISNSVSDKICSMAKHSRCESVLNSKGAKLFNWLTWGDVGMVYFTSSILFLLLSVLTNSSIQLYSYLSIVGIIFPVYSLYYQRKVVK